MTTPATLNGVTTTFRIDGIDMHTYGMVANVVRNPVPRARPKKQSISNLDGDLDFTNRYDTRIITIEGKIIADNHSQLLANIDEINKILLLKEDASAIYLIFNDQPTRQWTCRYDGAFDIEHESLWFSGRIARFSLQFACIKIYAESTTVTSETFNLSVLGQKQITYNGSYPAPIQVVMSANMKENLLEKVAGNCSESGLPWTSAGCAVGTNTSSQMFGSASVKFLDVSSDGGSASIDVTSQVIVTPRSGIVAGCYVRVQTPGDLSKVKVAIQHNGTGDGGPVYFSGNNTIGFAFKKVSASDLATATSAVFVIAHDAGIGEYEIDGAFIYTITQAEFNDSTYFPPPYVSDTSGDDKQPLVNPKLLLYRNSNLLFYARGNNNTGWTSSPALWGDTIAVVPDPVEAGKKCFLLKTKNDKSAFSPVFFLVPNSEYKIKFEYYLRKLPATTDPYSQCAFEILERPEGVLASGLWSTPASIYVTSATSCWTSGSFTYNTSSFANIGMFAISLSAYYTPNLSEAELYIRNIQIEKGSSFSSYKPDDVTSFHWTGTLDQFYENNRYMNDVLVVDGERLTASKYTASTEITSNALSGVSEFSKLVLRPGANVLRLSDARYGSSTPETASCGYAEITLSYRERYL